MKQYSLIRKFPTLLFLFLSTLSFTCISQASTVTSVCHDIGFKIKKPLSLHDLSEFYATLNTYSTASALILEKAYASNNQDEIDYAATASAVYTAEITYPAEQIGVEIDAPKYIDEKVKEYQDHPDRKPNDTAPFADTELKNTAKKMQVNYEKYPLLMGGSGCVTVN